MTHRPSVRCSFRLQPLPCGMLVLAGVSGVLRGADAARTKPVPGLLNYCGFEGYWGEGGWVDSGFATAKGSPVSFDFAIRFHGKASVRIPGGANHFAYNLVAPIFAQLGKTYVFRGYVKVEKVEKEAWIKVLAASKSQNKVLGYVPVEGPSSFKGTADWQPFSLAVSLFPSGTETVTLYVGLEGPGTAWYDEVSFAEKGVVVPLGGRLALTEEDYGGVRFDDRSLPANLLLNPGFEEDFTGWFQEAGPSEIDGAVAHSGKKSLKLAGRELLHYSTMQSVRIDPRRAYELWGWVKTSNLVSMSYVMLICWDKYNRAVPSAFMFVQDSAWEFLYATGTHDWQRKTMVFRAFPPDTDHVTVYLCLSDARGTVWIDDVGLRPLTLADSPEARPGDG